MQTLKHIDVWSAAKVAAVLNLIIAIILAVVLVIFGSTFNSVFGSANPLVAQRLGRLFLVLPVIGFVVGLVFTIIEAVIYNFLANRAGGIKVQFKKAQLVAVDPWSVAKIFAVLGVILGVIAAIIGVIIGIAFPMTAAAGGPAIWLLICVVLVVLLAIGGLVFGAIGSVVYNLLAKKIGGIEFNIKNKEFKSIGIWSYVKMNAILSVIIGFIEGVIFVLIHSAMPVASAPALVGTLGVASIVVYPIIYLIVGIVSSAINGGLYNWIAGMIGGVKVLIS